MANPNNAQGNLLEDIMREITSALSSLNMKPELLSKPLNDLEYLSSTDMWAAHAVEHINAALKILHLITSSGTENTLLLKTIAIQNVIASQYIGYAVDKKLDDKNEIIEDWDYINSLANEASRYLLDDSSLFKGIRRMSMTPSRVNVITGRTEDVTGYPEHPFLLVEITISGNHYVREDPQNPFKATYLYFDLDCPEGISDWMQLPTFKKFRGEEIIG